MKEIQIKVNVEGTEESLSNVSKLEQELEKLNKQRDDLINSSGKGLNNFTKELSDLDSEISKLEKSYESVTNKSQKFEQKQKTLEGVTKTISGSINLATATLATFGIQNEEVEKTLLKVQAAASFSQGLKDLQEGFKGLGLTFGSLTKIMLANPFVLIATLVAGLIGYFGGFEAIISAVTGAVSSLFTGLGKMIGLIDESGDAAAGAALNFDSLSSSVDNYRQSLDDANSELERQIKVLEASGKSTLSQQNQIIENKLKQLELDKALIQTQIAFEKGLGGDVTELQRELNGVLQQEKDLRTDITVNTIKNNSEIQASNKETIDKKKEEEQKALAASKKAQDDSFKNLQNNLNSEVDAIKKIQEDKVNILNQEFLDGKMSYETLQAEKILIGKETNNDIIKLRDEFRLTDEEKIKIGLNNYKTLVDTNQKEITSLTKINGDIDIQLKKGVNDFEKQSAQELADFESKLRQDKLAQELKSEEERKKREEQARKDRISERDLAIQLGADTLNSLSTLSDIYFKNKSAKAKGNAKEEEEIAKKQFKVQKALQLGIAVINGIQSILAITSVPDFTLGVATALRIGSQVVLNLASIAQIAATKFEGGGGSSTTPSTTPSVPSINAGGSITPTTFNPSVFGSNVSQEQTFGNGGGGNNNQGGGILRAVVVESDITNVQKRLGSIRNTSEL